MFLERHGVVVAILYHRIIGLSHDNDLLYDFTKLKIICDIEVMLIGLFHNNFNFDYGFTNYM